jgi:PAS domain S-box-containing protein
MDETKLIFDKEQFNKLFPFFILINSDLQIIDQGETIKRLCGSLSGNSLVSHFQFIRPELPAVNFDILKNHCNQLLILKLITNEGQRLRGQFEYLPHQNQFLFVGSPWFDTIEQLNQSKLTFSDFAYHDPLIDLLHVLKNQEIVNDDLKALLKTISLQKKELNKISEENKSIALFPMQNPDPLLRIDFDGRILMRNPAAEDLKFYTYKNTTLPCEDFWKLIAQEGNYKFDRYTFEIESNNKTYSFLCRYLPAQSYFNVYGRDVTKEKINALELKRLSFVASANNNGVLFNNAKGEILWANESYCKMLGYTLNEIIGKQTLDFCKGLLSDEKQIKKIAKSIGENGTFNEELIHYKKDGTWFWGRVKVQSYTNNDQTSLEYFSILEDITNEKKKEEQLKILSQIAENNVNGVVITDKDGLVTWVNKSYSALTGYSLAESIGRKPGHLLQGPDTDVQTILYLKNQIQNGLPFNAEILNYTKYGKSYWLRIQGQPIFNDKKELSGFFALEENITEEKEIRKQIKESQERFKLVLEKIGDNVWELDLKSGSAVFRKSYHNFGNFSTNSVVHGESLWWSNVYHRDLDALKVVFSKYLTREVDFQNIEYRIVEKDGSIKWVLDRGVVIEKDEHGKPLRLIGTQTDITKIKLIETALEQRVRQFKSLSENVPGVIYEYEFRPDGTEGLKYVSPAVESIFGIKQADFQHDPTAFLLPEDQDNIAIKNQNCRNKLEPFYYESKILIPDGSFKWQGINSSFSYITENGTIVYTGFIMDITERKNIEENLKANEEKYRSIIANMNLGLLEVDLDDRILYANQSFCDLSGYTLDELMGNTAVSLLLDKETTKIIQEKSDLRKYGIADAYEIELNDKNGVKKWWLISGAPRFNDKKELIGSIGIHLDITQQKKLEKELIAARERAENLAHTKEIFLANMSHEIRTPMNAIIGMTDQLLKTSLNQNQKFFLEIINSASENLLVIINDILDLSKIEAGKLSFEKIGFNLKTVAERAIQVLMHKAEEKGLSLINSRFDDEIAPILIGDPFRLNQILLNLIGNAIKFTDYGTVDLSFALLNNDKNEQLVEIKITDTGIGMEPAFVEHIFDKFSQENESTSRNYGGTGLGMSITKELVDLMGGEISAQSQKHKGTTFTINICFKKGTKADLPKKNENKFKPNFLSGKNILITDDNELNRLIASIILKNYGAQTFEATNGKVALEIIQSEKIDVALMDIQMPGLNGYDATKAIRANGIMIPVIALTAEAIHGERQKCLNAGMNDYITKPFKENLFLNIINNWINMDEKEVALQLQKAEQKLFDPAALIEMSRGNTEFVKKMINLFCDQSPKMVAEMLEAYQNKNYESIVSLAHKIKASVDNLQIKTLSPIIRDIERIGKEDPENAILAILLDDTSNIIEKVIKQMKLQFEI